MVFYFTTCLFIIQESNNYKKIVFLISLKVILNYRRLIFFCVHRLLLLNQTKQLKVRVSVYWENDLKESHNAVQINFYEVKSVILDILIDIYGMAVSAFEVYTK